MSGNINEEQAEDILNKIKPLNATGCNYRL